MSPFERWLMVRIIRKETRQDYDHPAKFTALYAMITKAAKREFTEDNEATRRHYLQEWFEAQFSPVGARPADRPAMPREAS